MVYVINWYDSTECDIYRTLAAAQLAIIQELTFVDDDPSVFYDDVIGLLDKNKVDEFAYITEGSIHE